MSADLFAVRSLLFLPASNPRAIAKARQTSADLVILDLEDAVKAGDKSAARGAAVEAVRQKWPMPIAIRINGASSPRYEEDVAAVQSAEPDFLVLPKVENPLLIERIAERTGLDVIAMIESPSGVLAAAEIARARGLAGLIAGTNDLAASLNVPMDSARPSLSTALQTIVLAGRAAGIALFDGVFNRLDDAEGFAAECGEGRRLGFDGKALIHPNQIEACNRAFSPGAAEVERARRLIDAATGGAERFEDSMIESMHVEAARRLLERARA